MPIQITRTKLIPPRRRADLLSRQRLLDILFDLMDYKLAIIAAPAGYGKTSLLIDFIQHNELTACWLSLDTLDQDPQRFLAHFIASIAQQFPDFGKQSLAALDANPARLDLDYLVTTIVNEAFEHIREHYLLILDDYHLINEQKEISYFISHFVQEVDENCHLILASRTLLTLPEMPLMVARSMVGGLSFEELAFQTEEIRTLIYQNYQQVISIPAAEELVHSTEGWITGLLLSTQTNHPGLTDRMRLHRVSQVGLYDYLAQQVLDQQPPETRRFLIRTSLLEEFNIALCEAIFGTNEDWSSQFRNVLLSNLFILPVGEDGSWIRYHHLFRDFLQTRMADEDPQEFKAILLRLAFYYANSQEWEKAHAIYVRLKDLTGTADLIEQAGPWLVKNSRIATIRNWIDSLPVEILSSRPNLLSLRAVPEQVVGQGEKSLALLDQAEGALRTSGDQIGLARTLTRRSITLRSIGRYTELMEDARRALEISRSHPELRNIQADALRALGGSYYQTGRLDEALDHLSRSLEVYLDLTDRANSAVVQMEIGLVLQGIGRYRQALEYCQTALEYFKAANDPMRQANLLNNLGVLHNLLGNYEQASAIFEDALLKARQNHYSRIEAFALTSIGDMYTELEALNSALEAYRMAQDVARVINNHFLQVYTELAIAGCYRTLGNLEQARECLRNAGQLIEGVNSPYEEGLYALESGRLNDLEGNLAEALQSLETANQKFDSSGQPIELTRAKIFLADAQMKAKNLYYASELIEQAINMASKLESQHFLLVSSSQATQLLETLNQQRKVQPSIRTLYRQVTEFQANIPVIRKRMRTRTASVPFAPPRLTIKSLGRTLVELDSKPVNVPEWQNQRKVRELFFYILIHPGGVSKEEIGLAFWPESSNSQLKLQFKNAIYRMRHALGPDIVLFNENYYWFNRDLDYEFDVETFDKHCLKAESADNRIDQITAYKAAITAYQGSFLLDAEGSWVSTEREKLELKLQQVLLRLGQLCFESGDFDEAITCCQRLLDIDPCLEEAHRLAMQVYAKRGNRAAINRQYERCRLALGREINTTPSPQTVTLYESLLL